MRNQPFILRPKQSQVVRDVNDAIIEQHNLVVDKSRDEGATELVTGVFTVHWLLDPDSQFLVGSRKEEYVDRGVTIVGDTVRGSHKCLFHKICYKVVHAPRWMRPNFLKTEMSLQNLDNHATIGGEATNENFGAGDRPTACLVDEHGAMMPAMASSIIDRLNDSTGCIIYNSTHYYGVAHPYNQLLSQKLGKIKVVSLPWEENPMKNMGLYRSPSYDVIEIKDIDYYRANHPGFFDDIEPMIPFKLSAFLRDKQVPTGGKLRFVADGGDYNEGGWRGVWYDQKVETRSPRDVAQNIDRRPLGSGNAIFHLTTLRRIRLDALKPATSRGSMDIKKDTDGKVLTAKYVQDSGSCHLKLWCSLVNGRPRQDHNYIVAGDISLGLGASNSTLGIYDCNTGEKIGSLADSNITPEPFADLAVAICKWVGGDCQNPYLIWEANGCGGIFGKRVRFHGYPNFHIRRDETALHKYKQNKIGWHSTNEGKLNLLVNLDSAYAEGLKTCPQGKWLRLYDEDTLGEAEAYIMGDDGTCGPAASLGDSSGARSAHGDRVIPDGLFVLALDYQKAAAEKQKQTIGRNCLAWRMKQRKLETDKTKLTLRFPNG